MDLGYYYNSRSVADCCKGIRCDRSVAMSVCICKRLSVRLCITKRRTSPNIARLSVHIVCRRGSLDGGRTISYVLPVLMMTAYLHKMAGRRGPWATRKAYRCMVAQQESACLGEV